MKIKTENYGVFYKNGKHWQGPLYEEILTLDDIRYNSPLDRDSSIEDHIEAYLQDAARGRKRKVKLFREMWERV